MQPATSTATSASTSQEKHRLTRARTKPSPVPLVVGAAAGDVPSFRPEGRHLHWYRYGGLRCVSGTGAGAGA
eukprot:13021-Heterococcus_DN1.PRE.2